MNFGFVAKTRDGRTFPLKDENGDVTMECEHVILDCDDGQSRIKTWRPAVMVVPCAPDGSTKEALRNRLGSWSTDDLSRIASQLDLDIDLDTLYVRDPPCPALAPEWFRVMMARRVWERLEDALVDDDGTIDVTPFETPYLGRYEIGTNREEIWHDIESRMHVSVAYLMGQREEVW